MSSHEEAVDMVNYHKENPASLYGKPLSFYLSKTLLVIEVRPEVFVKARLPRLSICSV